MHMADALVSPVVGGVMWAATAGATAYAVRKMQQNQDTKAPLMGVMGAFVFAAQMINFTIPGTGSSGHLSGALLLAAILGPHAAFLSMAVILMIQALFFADGGLLAYGCNVMNMAFFACYVAYPLYRKITGKGMNGKRILMASLVSAVAALQMGAFGVVLETLLSGRTELPFAAFTAAMQPIHLAIGVVEGLVTAAVLTFVWKAQPEILQPMNAGKTSGKKVIIAILVATALVGGVVSWFASANPDGLEWSIARVSGQDELENSNAVQEAASNAQERIAPLPDYALPDGNECLGTSVSGIVGGAVTIGVLVAAGWVISRVKKRSQPHTV